MTNWRLPKLGLLTEQDLILFNAYYALTSSRANLDSNMNIDSAQAYFFRKVPTHLGSYILAVGLEQTIAFIDALQDNPLSEEQAQWLQATSSGDINDDMVEYLMGFDPVFDIWAVPEGTPMFPNEPIIVIKGKANDIQIVEDGLLSNMNHQSLIATKASRIRFASGKRSFVNFGTRRAHGWGSAFYGARASYIGGTDGDSLTLAGYKWDMPYIGTMPHSFIQLRQRPDTTFSDSELEAFMDFAKTFPHNCLLLVDTYNTVNGVMNAIAVGRWLRKEGHELKGIRLDSGDMVKLSKLARTMLDNAGMHSARIYVSDSLDEYEITRMLEENAPIDGVGVGTRLVTGANINPLRNEGSSSALGGVLKLVWNGSPNMKFTDNRKKSTLPGLQQVWRVHDPRGLYVEDFISLMSEKLEGDFVKPLLVPIVERGEIVYDFPSTKEIKKYSEGEVRKIKRGLQTIRMDRYSPPTYSVDLSPGLRKVQEQLIEMYKLEFAKEKSVDSRVEDLEKFMRVMDERNKIEERLRWEINSKWGEYR